MRLRSRLHSTFQNFKKEQQKLSVVLDSAHTALLLIRIALQIFTMNWEPLLVSSKLLRYVWTKLVIFETLQKNPHWCASFRALSPGDQMYEVGKPCSADEECTAYEPAKCDVDGMLCILDTISSITSSTSTSTTSTTVLNTTLSTSSLATTNANPNTGT